METSPWMRPLAALKVLYRLPEHPKDVPEARLLALLNEAANTASLSNQQGIPIRFVSATNSPLPLGGAIGYESHIYQTGQIPTRSLMGQWPASDVLHDYLNALMWLAWPKTKMALNAAQYSSVHDSVGLECANSGSQRGPLRDRLTLLDESGIIVLCEKSLGDMLRGKRWTDLFVTHRSLVEQGRLQAFVVGHGLLQRLHAPFKSITGHAWVFERQDLSGDESLLADTLMASRLSDSSNLLDRSVPIPLMGLPNWHKSWFDGEQDEAFYNDSTVFRAAVAVQ
jgi:Protein of unknown function (DUF3025)